MRTALGLFTAIPVRPSAQLDRRGAVRAIAALPGVGALVGVLAALPMLLLGWAGLPLLGGVLGVAALAWLTGALHLDGLADTADGLGSRRPAEAALAIMRRSDIGPMGVIALLLVLLADVAALASLTPAPWAAPAALLLATVTGRFAVVIAARGRAARADGFGALFRGVRHPGALVGNATATLVLALGLGWGVAGASGAAVFALSAGLAVAVGRLWQRHLAIRLGGMTGDTFGSIVEVAQTVVLVAVCVGLRLT